MELVDLLPSGRDGLVTLSCLVGSTPTDYTIFKHTGTERRIMKKILLTLLAVPLVAQAQWDFDNSGGRVFDMSKNFTSKTTITLRYVDNVEKECNAESKRLGGNGFGNSGAMACSFWYESKCTIITAKKVDMRTIGHEVMHCFQGSWHN